MISLQIINLLPKQQHPYILTQEFNHIQCIREARSVAGESIANPQSNMSAHDLRPHIIASPPIPLRS